MPKLSIWNSGRKSNDYRFIDRTISEYFSVGGTAAYIHKYLGVHDAQGNPTDPDDPKGELKIQDMLFLENRDRRYAKDIIELRAIYNIQDSEFDLKQFGLFISNDSIFVEFHLNDMIADLGRKLMNGDVLELPHLRDDALLDPDAKAINKFYVVVDAMRASDGYSQTWFPHIWRVKCEPITDRQEYIDVLDKTADDPFGLSMDSNLRDLMSNINREFEITDAVIEEAREHVMQRNFETRQFYVVPGDDMGMQYPWVFAGDGEPPNGAVLTGSGTRFPDNAQQGDYYLRTDYEPYILYQKDGNKWARREVDYRQGEWSMAHRLLKSFINNRATSTHDDGTILPEKTPLSKAILPKSDF